LKTKCLILLVAISLLPMTVPSGAQERPQPPSDPAACRRVADLLYVEGGDSHLQALDVHVPGDARDSPVLIWIHGGGLSGGDKGEEVDKAAYFCRNGFVVVVPNHRLSPAVKHPAHVEDGSAAVAWTLAHVRELGGDPERVALAGYNTGGFIVAHLGIVGRSLKDRGLSPSKLRALVLLDGHDFDVEGTAKALAGSPAMADVHQRMGEDPATWREATIAPQVRPDTGIPPTLIVVSENPRAHYKPGVAAKPLLEALEQAGVEATYYVAKGKDAIQVGRDVASGDDMSRTVLEFLRRHVAP
jgi:acetyl esterase/lipase